MSHRPCMLVLILLVTATAAGAQTLRRASRGDVGSMDPHAFNEGSATPWTATSTSSWRGARDQSIEPRTG